MAQQGPLPANRGSRPFQDDFVDCLTSQTFPVSPVKVQRMFAHLQRPLNLSLVLCDRNWAAIKAAGPYVCCAIDIAVVIWHGKKDYFLNRFQQTHHIPEVVSVALATLKLNPCATRLAANKQTEASNG